MSIDNSTILSLAPADSQAVFLFGSYARGDETAQSDIDILAVVSPSFSPTPPLHAGLCCYTFRQLQRMAKRGSLFVLHLISEGKAIRDPRGILSCLSEMYIPASFSYIRNEINWSSKLLTTNKAIYEAKKEKYNRLVINLIRTMAFAKVADSGQPLFSMTKVAVRLNLSWLAALPRPDEIEWSIYLDMLRRLSSLSGSGFNNPYHTIEALIAQSWYKSSMCVGMGLRLLSNEANLIYEDADLRWFIDD